MHKLAPVAATALLLCASSAFADEEPHVVSARVVSFESADQLAHMTCDLVAIANVGGRARFFDVSVDGKRCSSLTPQGDAVPLRVRIEPRPNGWHNVVLEADVLEGVSPSEMLAAVDGTARDLFERLNKLQQPVAPVVTPASDSRPAARGTRGGGIALMATGGAGLGLALMIGVVAMIESAGHSFGCGVSSIMGSSCGGQDLSGYGIAAGVAGGLGATFMVIGGIVLSAAPAKNVSAQIGPTGGSLRVAF